MALPSPRKEITTLRTLVGAIVTGIIGFALLSLATDNPANSWWAVHPKFEAIVRELGALLVSSVALYSLWELSAKRAFLRELRADVGIPRSIEAAGITGAAVESFTRDFDWEEALANTKTLELFVAYASTWRNANRTALTELAGRRGTRVRIFLPSTSDPVVLAELADRFALSEAEMRSRIEAAAKDFQDVFVGKKAKFELWYVSAAPLYSFYRFDEHAYISLYKHRRKRDYVPPTIVIRKGGTMWKFLDKEIDALVAGDRPLASKFVTRATTSVR